MIAYAFKNAAVSGDFWSKTISRVTGGPYCHVEMWLSGPRNKAWCFSSREGQGTGFKTIDLTTPAGLWTVVELDLSISEELRVQGFCRGSRGHFYDYLGILGIGSGHGEHDRFARFCSEVCVEALQQCAGRWTEYHRWFVWPSGPRRQAGKNVRVGLYELATGQIK